MGEDTFSPRLLVVGPPRLRRPVEELTEFEVYGVSGLSDTSQLELVDCVVIALEDRARVDTVASIVDVARRELPMAMVLAGPGDPGVGEMLGAHEFDGFVDLSWPAPVAAACLHTAIRHAQVDRNVLEIQREVLRCSRVEAEHLFSLAAHDDLTGLYNRRHFFELLAREHDRARRHDRPYGLVFVDLDDLKGLNTRYGHAGGSRVLRELSQVLTSSLRSSDVVGRVGGDEFVVLLDGCDRHEATLLAERIRGAIHCHEVELGAEHVAMSASLGVASYPEDGAEPVQVLGQADRALLRAKADGKNRAVCAR